MEKGCDQNHSAEVVVHWLYYHEDSHYVLNVSLIEGARVTQVRTHGIVSSVKYTMNGQEG